jgi:hypothetical protein
VTSLAGLVVLVAVVVALLWPDRDPYRNLDD